MCYMDKNQGDATGYYSINELKNNEASNLDNMYDTRHSLILLFCVLQIILTYAKTQLTFIPTVI